MTGTIADLNIHTVPAEWPGLSFRRVTTPTRARVALICSDGRGATELWMTDVDALPESVRGISSVRHSGGIEIHAPTGPDDPDDGGPVDCDVLPGGRCYPRGVRLDGLMFPGLIEAGDSAAVLRLLGERHERAFGGDKR